MPTSIYTVSKFCNYCKKAGHSREDCWNLKERPNHIKIQEYRTGSRGKWAQEKEKISRKRDNSETESSNSEGERKDDKRRQPRPASEYQIAHINDTPHTQTRQELLIVKLPIQEAKNNSVNMLYDSGSIVSLIKLKNLKGNALIYEDKITLTGITGHHVHTIGRVHTTIKIDNQKRKHTLYVIKDDTPIEHDGILGIDFLQKHTVVCNYEKSELKIGDTTLKLYPYHKIILQPRSETIIKATTNKNHIGIVHSKEIAPGIYIGNCLVKAENYSCPVSMINTTNVTIEVRNTHVDIKELETETKIHAIHTENHNPTTSRIARI